ncbi:HD-GYP domain-containing protein [Glaciecola sp. 2405UD65-10]|uniref:HD-GYP domain-containing protein n=1 Tax=Glaciecola sp. 2405UD65-10 TaxID=3397244 RepID=UPI003B5CC669
MKKIVSIDELQVGMFVHAITQTSTKLAVKSQGVVKTQSTIDMLKNNGIEALEIDLSKGNFSAEQAESGPPPSISNKNISCEQHQQDLTKANKLYSQSRSIHSDFLHQLKGGQSPDFDSLHTLSQEIIDSVFENTDALACLVMLQESDDYLVQHSLNCSILMTIFAKFKGFSQAEVEDLTLAGLLMDCGMALLPSELYNNSAPLTEADHTLLRTHVDIGYEIAERFSDVPPLVLDIIAHHHERIDGTGYPKQLSGDDISVYSQMAGIVDSYENMLSAHHDASNTCSQAFLEDLQNNSAHDTELVNEFIKAIGLYPVGSLVKLTNGKLAIVVKRNYKDPLKPTVMTFYSTRNKHLTEVKRIDLYRQSSDKIVGCVRPDEFNLNLPGFFKSALLDK